MQPNHPLCSSTRRRVYSNVLTAIIRTVKEIVHHLFIEEWNLNLKHSNSKYKLGIASICHFPFL
jgi:hypothetical protein